MSGARRLRELQQQNADPAEKNELVSRNKILSAHFQHMELE